MKIILDVESLIRYTINWEGPIACDTETRGEMLLGVSLSQGQESLYVPINQWNKTKQTWEKPSDKTLCEGFGAWLSEKQLIGHNFTYDKRYIDKEWSINSDWMADTRIMWHLASAPSGPRPYGLKDAQVELLGWEKKGDAELEQEVKKHGGSLRNGDHYLADLSILANYACLDALSTFLIYKKLEPFFQEHDYTWMIWMMMDYNTLLSNNTQSGVLVDRKGLQAAHDRLVRTKEAAKKRLLKELDAPISELERDWADRKIALYKREYNRTRYANNPALWEKFNFNSDAHKRELFYEKLKHPIIYTTESGAPSCSADSIKRMDAHFVEAYLKYEKANTLSTNFTTSYLVSSDADSRLHPGFNICGTVSYRLSGFKPYLLNAPFDEKAIMRHLRCDPGYVGVHADLSAIEPTITAHYSEDVSLLKVFRDGLGDIYLDLALEIFSRDKELHEGYNPNIPITKAVKEQFNTQRKTAKVVQLAVQYGGTGHTVAKNLSKDGVKTSVEEADGYVRAYWRKFSKVKEFNYRLKTLNARDGHLRNVIGRIIRVPDPNYKDLSNRFIQSSAHDVLVLWVLEIYKMCKEQGIGIKPILLDCHDSTSNQCPEKDVDKVQAIYKQALDSVNDRLSLAVYIKAESKTFTTLAGLKGEE